jgi:hypothetical protein
MKILRGVQYFSRMSNYLERFKSLEQELIKIEKEVIEKEDYVGSYSCRLKGLKWQQSKPIKIKS